MTGVSDGGTAGERGPGSYCGWCLSCDVPWTPGHAVTHTENTPRGVFTGEALDDDAWTRLRAIALGTAPRAYAPYSKFHVGAALACADGQVFVGVNVENGAYTGTHAEQAAIAAWVAAGRPSTPRAVTSVALPSGDVQTSCGTCRQQLAELCGLELVVDDASGPVLLSELLPRWFAPEVLPDGIGPASAAHS